MRLTIPQILRLSQEQYGINVDSSQVLQANFNENEYLRDILSEHAVSPATIEEIAQKSASVFDVRLMRAGKPYTIIKSKADKVDYFIYEKNEADFVVIALRDSVHIYTGRKTVDRKLGELSGTIEASLFEEFEKQGADIRMVGQLEEVFAWTVDFYDLKKGDRFDILYQEEFVNGISMHTYQIQAASIEQDGEKYWAYRFPTQGDSSQYYDGEGQPLRKAFLKSPLDYKNVQERSSSEEASPELIPTRKSHLGIHYKADKGSAVYAVGDGEIIVKTRRSKQGNVLRIRHLQGYESQYEHLDRFAEDLQNGQKVKQGDLIGYVGRTGSVSRTQVCLRMWKDNKEVQPQTVEQPQTEALSGEALEAFRKAKKQLEKSLERLKKAAPSQAIATQ
ncbi:MAG: peptidoglycan DD-metalloendopeptidase family protein [Bacteroidota bacterium]